MRYAPLKAICNFALVMALLLASSAAVRAGNGCCDRCGCRDHHTKKKMVPVVTYVPVSTPCFECQEVTAFHPCKGSVCHCSVRPITRWQACETKECYQVPVCNDCCSTQRCKTCVRTKQKLCDCGTCYQCRHDLGGTPNGRDKTCCVQTPTCPGPQTVMPVIKWVAIDVCPTCSHGHHDHHHGHDHGGHEEAGH